MYGMYENDKQRKSPKQLQRELGINLGGGSWGQSLINHGEGTVGGHSRGGQHSDEVLLVSPQCLRSILLLLLFSTVAFGMMMMIMVGILPVTIRGLPRPLLQ